jgi:uncharacterized protein YlxW (UPF0749 family)
MRIKRAYVRYSKPAMLIGLICLFFLLLLLFIQHEVTVQTERLDRQQQQLRTDENQLQGLVVRLNTYTIQNVNTLRNLVEELQQQLKSESVTPQQRTNLQNEITILKQAITNIESQKTGPIGPQGPPGPPGSTVIIAPEPSPTPTPEPSPTPGHLLCVLTLCI